MCEVVRPSCVLPLTKRGVTEHHVFPKFGTKDLARSEEQVAAARAWLDAERVWLVHRGGFCAARQLRETDSGEALPEGRVRLKLEHNGDVIEVDEDDVEK
ncbi:hypothetical protein Pcinc_039234, partial [Petrolisthes cinctipes]